MVSLEPEREHGAPSMDAPVTRNGNESHSIPSHINTMQPGQAVDQNPQRGQQTSSQTRGPGNHKKNKTTRATLKVASLNIRGGGSVTTKEKCKHINQIMQKWQIAILAVQETYLKQTDIEEIHSQFYGRMEIKNTSDSDHPNAKGVTFVLNKQKMAWKEALVTEIIPGRAIRLEIPWQDAWINILVIYAPNSPAENAEFWVTLHDKWVQVNPPMPDIILGDFNLVEEMIDRLPAHADAHRAVDKLRDFKELLGLIDGWRRTNPTVKAYSFTQEATQSQSQIDQIYVTQPMYKNS